MTEAPTPVVRNQFAKKSVAVDHGHVTPAWRDSKAPGPCTIIDCTGLGLTKEDMDAKWEAWDQQAVEDRKTGRFKEHADAAIREFEAKGYRVEEETDPFSREEEKKWAAALPKPMNFPTEAGGALGELAEAVVDDEEIKDTQESMPTPGPLPTMADLATDPRPGSDKG